MGEPPRIDRIDHVGIVVESFDGLMPLLRDLLGLEVVGPEQQPGLAMEVLWARIGEVDLQFIRPTRDDTGAARVLREQGPGIHHLGLGVDDIDATLAALRARGVPLRDAVPRPGARGARVAFIDPCAVAGAELELIEPAAGPATDSV